MILIPNRYSVTLSEHTLKKPLFSVINVEISALQEVLIVTGVFGDFLNSFHRFFRQNNEGSYSLETS